MKILLLLAIFVSPLQVLTSSDVGLGWRKMEDCTKRRFTSLVDAKGVPAYRLGSVLQRNTDFYFFKGNQQFELGNTLDSLPTEPQLMMAIESYFQLQLVSELAEFNTMQKGKWLKYLPTLGVTYTLEGKPRPAISWSSNLLYSTQKDKAYLHAKKQSIYKKNQLALEKEKLLLHNLLRQYLFLQQDILILQDLLDYDRQLYHIQKDQAQHIEIPPSELLKATQTIKQKEYNILQKHRELLELEIKILTASKYFQYYENKSIVP